MWPMLAIVRGVAEDADLLVCVCVCHFRQIHMFLIRAMYMIMYFICMC